MITLPVSARIEPETALTARAAATVICTLGMHRSGTSLVSRLLNLLGVHLGPAQAIANQGQDNLKGYWEHLPLSQLNDEILAQFGGRWDAPPAFPRGQNRARAVPTRPMSPRRFCPPYRADTAIAQASTIGVKPP